MKSIIQYPKVSIIMPVYNAKEYIEDTIRSVLLQTVPDFELIIVDDGSSDGSALICENLAEKDTRIRLYRQENHGICYSRNYALTLARGKYIAFCDHDDIYEPDYLKYLVDAAEKNHADLVKGQYKGIIMDHGNEITNTTMDFLDGICSLSDLLSDYKYFLRTVNVLWNGLYANHIIKKYNIRFNETFRAGWEDNQFNLEYLKHAEVICGVNKLVYSHIRRVGQSASLGYNANRVESLIKVYKIETNYLDEHKELINGRTFMDYQIRFLDALKTELWYKDCSFTRRKKQEEIRDFVNNRYDFIKVSLLDIVASFKSKPKVTVKWLLFHLHLSPFLCLYWNLSK